MIALQDPSIIKAPSTITRKQREQIMHLAADLLREIDRLTRIHDEQGLYPFLCECQDGWLYSRSFARPNPLFALSSPDGKLRMRPDGKPVGCPFSIRQDYTRLSPVIFAWTDEWTRGIWDDPRIPRHEAWFRPPALWALAEWQQTFRDYFEAEKRRGRVRVATRRARLRRLCS